MQFRHSACLLANSSSRAHLVRRNMKPAVETCYCHTVLLGKCLACWATKLRVRAHGTSPKNMTCKGCNNTPLPWVQTQRLCLYNRAGQFFKCLHAVGNGHHDNQLSCQNSPDDMACCDASHISMALFLCQELTGLAAAVSAVDSCCFFTCFQRL